MIRLVVPFMITLSTGNSGMITTTFANPVESNQQSIPKATHTNSTCTSHTAVFEQVNISGLKDSKGNLRVELYPANEDDFLKNMIKRVEVPADPASSILCIDLPAPGMYAIVVHHDRNSNNHFDLFTDGFGFSNNPRLFFSPPKVDKTKFSAVSGANELDIQLNYY